MALKAAILILTLASASAANAQSDEAAPSGTADTRYCMKIEPTTGTLVSRTVCWTREQWANQGVDVDMDWAENGVRTVG